MLISPENDCFSNSNFLFLYLCRLKDLKPVWARLTALIVRDVSEQMENGGKRTPAPYVNAEYVHHICLYVRNGLLARQLATYTFSTDTSTLRHAYTVINHPWSCVSISVFLFGDRLSICTICMWAVFPVLNAPVSLSGTPASVSPLGSTLLLAPVSPHSVFVCTSRFSAFHSLSLPLFQCQLLAEVIEPTC